MQTAQAILIADHEAPALHPFTESLPPCLLPVAGRPVLVHVLDELCEFGITKVFIVMSSFPEMIRAALDDGHRWGLEVEYVLTAGNERFDEILKRTPWDREQPVVISSADRVRGGANQAFLKRLEIEEKAAPSSWRAFDGRGRDLGLTYLVPNAMSIQRMVLEDSSVAPILTPEALFQANKDALDGILTVDSHSVETHGGGDSDNVLDGAPTTTEDGLLAGNGVVVHDSAEVVGKCMAGARCRMGANATLGPNAVLGRRVFIDEGATVRNSVILAETYVGRGVVLDGVIADANHVIDIHSLQTEDSPNEALLSSVSPRTYRDSVEGAVHRLIALSLWFLTLPLWPLLLLGSVLENPRKPFSSQLLLGNRRKAGKRQPFRVWTPELRMRIFISITRLWSVIRGDLRLVGVTPELLPAPDEVRSEDSPWLEALESAPAGVISPGRISASEDLMEKQITDAMYAQNRSFFRDFMLLMKSPFKAAA